MSSVLVISNDSKYTYDFRREVISEIIKNNYSVTIVTNFSSKMNELQKLGVNLIESNIDRRGKNPFKDLCLFRFYRKIIKKMRPDVVLTYTIKPNIYGGLVSRLHKVAYFPNITGLGTAVENKGILQFITIKLYKIALKNAKVIFFQNKENMNFMNKKGIKGKKHLLLPGSGVNVQYYGYLSYLNSKKLHFLFIGRVMKEKGIDYYLNAAKIIKLKYPNTVFHVLGSCEEDYIAKLNEYEKKGIIKYHGKVENVQEFQSFSHCTIHPTYYPEGMSNVLLESAASGRPIIASNRSGCREIIDNGKNGFLVETKNLEDLVNKIEKFINLPYEKKRNMGLYGRNKVIKEFNRNIVVNQYLNEIQKNGGKS